MTNFEKAQTMNIDEFAEFLNEGRRVCFGCRHRFEPYSCVGKPCVDEIKKWLESEAVNLESGGSGADAKK